MGTFHEMSVHELVRAMTLKEKVSLLSGLDDWRTVPIDRLGIPSITMTDGPHGVRANFEHTARARDVSTAFPSGVSMAATWNEDLIRRVGSALAEETRALGCHVLLGPCVNIVRHPLAGRNFETYSEDPFLAGRIGVAWVTGVQAQGIGASLKHFACNNQETERMRGSSNLDEQTLREIYLPAFEMIVRHAHPWTVMCAYNRVNGVYASENEHLLREILKHEWRYDGVVVSDWGANHSTILSVKNGLDLEMPGPARHYGDALVQAVLLYQVEQNVVDEAAERVVRLVKRAVESDAASKLDAEPKTGSLNTDEHQRLAREVALEAITLLKNDDTLLPLDIEQFRSLAVIGPNAVDLQTVGAGSSFVESPHVAKPLDALRKRLGADFPVEYEKGCDNHEDAPVIPRDFLKPPAGEGSGMLAEFFEGRTAHGRPLLVKNEGVEQWWWGRGPIDRDEYHVRFSGRLRVPEAGTYRLYLENTGVGRLSIADAVLENEASRDPNDPVTRSDTTIVLEAETDVPLTLELTKSAGDGYLFVALKMERVYASGEDDRIARAVELAERSGRVVVFAGMAAGYETEGRDRPHMMLPNRQNQLIEAVADANPNTVVVLNAGSPVSMPWIDRVSAVLLVYYPGMEGGEAIADILLGNVSPSGKLPVTFPVRLEDSPAFLQFPGSRDVPYGEGLFVGYRFYDKRDLRVLFPFGHGLTYSEFAFRDLTAPDELVIGDQGFALTVGATVTNTGTREASETAQLYVALPGDRSVPRPPQELKGFRKVRLKPGESQTVIFELDRRSLSVYDPYTRDWVVTPGEVEIRVGASSRDIRLRKRLRLDVG